ncbi:MAG: copper chaperone PCu(A)C [Acidimicrobiales bacterium]|nr:copper chaperone PCu(A)C [Acidimicrobiales bacterium]
MADERIPVRSHRTLLLAAAVGSSLLVAACGGDDDTAATTLDPGAATTTAAPTDTETAPAPIEVLDARLPEPAGANAAVYLVIRNAGDADDTLVGASTDVAARAELHRSTMQDGLMTMEPVSGGIPLPAGTDVVLEPGGLHVMLFDVQALDEGDTLTLTLELAQGDPVTVDVPVTALVPPTEGDMGGGMGGDPGHGGMGEDGGTATTAETAG